MGFFTPDISHHSQCSNQGKHILISDIGHWFNAKKEHGCGLELVDLLLRQLDGKFERSDSVYRFELSNLDH